MLARTLSAFHAVKSPARTVRYPRQVSVGNCTTLQPRRILQWRRFCGPADRDFNPEIARKLVDEDGALVLDVRSEGEFQMGALEEAEHIPHMEIIDRADELKELTAGNTEKPIVVYCAKGIRANVAKQMLEQMGYGNVVNLGGIAEVQAFYDMQKKP